VSWITENRKEERKERRKKERKTEFCKKRKVISIYVKI
jgi:hypothetical protein